ncbi:heme-binding protein 2-like isoform X2 [Crassostrea angulata]|uniref:Heme-binding protein 2 n=1 Tax=Magallana gigas TaxID=29159 RepID=A0A8W8LY78_MAGGI|nr:heme-binding protein 2 isoform X2 [Crassostrea gigas]XP_052680653.1 heme-binding protein 2-like isoform X2 [Crassostrea angulata]
MTSILKTIGSVVSSKGLDKPAYEVLSSEKNYELRRYSPAKWVSYTVKSMKKKEAQTEGFWKLFNYIQGENEKEMKVEMTAPVSTRVEPGAGPNCESTFTVSFFIPPEHQENPPQPKNPNVFIEERPGFEAYVRSFGGFANEDSWVTEAKKLSEDLKEKTSEIRQDFWYTAGYNSPFQLFGRTNEIWFVKK